jgi:uroporphyrinogen III methyltransferase/synthase
MADDVKGPGTIYLVGAGPGHPGLITRWGYDLLQQCDAVAYDALIPMELIAALPERIERHYVGKRAGRHSLPQQKINELLVTLARRGMKVVRLKGGDPSIFGRSGEEADYLTDAGVPVVTVPGVTSASAAAAMCGFSLTKRHSSSWVFLATGHGAEAASVPVPWDKVAALPGGTIVIYMGLAKLEQLVSELLVSGLSPDTPAMVVQAASTGIQSSVEAPLARLSLECKRQGLIPPALIIIGEAIHSRANDQGRASARLKGKRVLVTCPQPMTTRLCTLLREEGAEPIPYPTVKLSQFDDVEAWPRCLEAIKEKSLCLFTGDLEVDYFFDLLLAHGRDLRSLNRVKVLAWGDSTHAALLRRGIRADEVITPADFSGLARLLSRLDPNESLPLLWPRRNLEDPLLESNLFRLPFYILPLTVSAVSTASWEGHWGHALIGNPPDYIAFTGIPEVKGFFELLGNDVARHLAGKSSIAALGGGVAEALREFGLQIQVRADAGTSRAFLQALVDHSQERITEAVISRVS